MAIAAYAFRQCSFMKTPNDIPSFDASHAASVESARVSLKTAELEPQVKAPARRLSGSNHGKESAAERELREKTNSGTLPSQAQRARARKTSQIDGVVFVDLLL